MSTFIASCVGGVGPTSKPSLHWANYVSHPPGTFRIPCGDLPLYCCSEELLCASCLRLCDATLKEIPYFLPDDPTRSPRGSGSFSTETRPGGVRAIPNLKRMFGVGLSDPPLEFSGTRNLLLFSDLRTPSRVPEREREGAYPTPSICYITCLPS